MSIYHLVSWGANSHGQLGQGMLFEQCVLPQEVNLSGCSLRSENIRKIVGGAGHTLILDTNGRVYSCGLNNKGQAGVDVKQKNVLTFQQIHSLEHETIVDVCCGWDSSAALTRDGDLYVWGSNRYGQLGLDTSDFSQISHARRILIGEKIKRVSMGLRHTAVVTENGSLYICGANNKGQLGLNEPKECCACSSKFIKVLESRLQGNRVEDVACGQHHTIVVTRKQKDMYDMYGFGDNKHGQLEIFSKISSETLQCVQTNFLLDAPVQIYTGWSHINILSNGTVLSWGRSDYGQLGRFSNPQVSTELRRIDSTRKIIQLAVGSEHNVALADDGAILCWGWNEHGNCGNGNTENVLRPEVLSLPSNFVGYLVGAGAGHSFAVIREKDTS
ncbi:secretion-regulating guanine nucleotide exchange factor-like [Pseudomyrmex gracilis]|uniref:secretion-regulating guanine nucleotide exchange factor-like n=1 Tax=Pseudomyrmex gracilis TaxID=219809 RepID=UPI0009952938|nr:secretion-regulating guanine nucleotide exchange factor-like [Pseudomyrmex gracilis]